MKILLVDDNDPFRKALERLLARVLGHDVWALSNLEDAKAALLGGEFDILITDTEMPSGWEGPALIDLALEKKPNVRCVLMSGNPENEKKAREHNVDFIQKPFDLDDLKQLLKT